MKNTWASGAIELLKHANDHMKLNSSFDKKMAFISIDNCVELTLKSYLSLPKRFFGDSKPKRSELDAAFNSFPGLLDLISRYGKDKLEGVDINDIEHYHRIRNTLYHQGTGLSVDESYVEIYFLIAEILLKNLFDIVPISAENNHKSFLSEIMVGWSQIEHKVNSIFNQRNIERRGVKWSILNQERIITNDLLKQILDIRATRNKVAHSNSFELDVDKNILKSILDVKSELDVLFDSFAEEQKMNFFYYPNESVIEGDLEIKLFYGPPNFGEDPPNDMKQYVAILNLNSPINVLSGKEDYEEGDYDVTYQNIKQVQISYSGDKTKFVNKRVRVHGVFYGSHTGHHKTDVVLDTSMMEIVNKL